MAKCEKHTNFKGDFGCPVCWLEEREQLQAEVERLKGWLEKIQEKNYSPSLAKLINQALKGKVNNG